MKKQLKRKIITILTSITAISSILTIPYTASAQTLPPATDETYTPRTESPNINNPAEDPYYYDANYNPFAISGLQLPNCTTYAYGRAYEILGHDPELSTGSANVWYQYNKENGPYEYGQEPRRGAVACWENHVGIVEYVAPDKSYIQVSESAYNNWNRYFVLETYYREDNTYPMYGRQLYGFIYLIKDPEPKPVIEEKIEIPADKTFAGWKNNIYIADTEDDSWINMRSEPNTYSDILGEIMNNEEVTVLETIDTDEYKWGKITQNDVTGWVALNFFKQKDNEPILKKKCDVNENGKFEINDITDVQRVLACKTTGYEVNEYIADEDGDGRISISDATTMQRILAEFESIENKSQILYPKSKKLEYIKNGEIINTKDV